MLVSVTGAPPLQAEQSVNATPRKVPPGQAEQSTVLVPPSRAETCMVTPRTYSVVTPWLVKAGEGLEHGQSFVYACCAVVVSSWRPGVTFLSACLSIVCTPPSWYHIVLFVKTTVQIGSWGRKRPQEPI